MQIVNAIRVSIKLMILVTIVALLGMVISWDGYGTDAKAKGVAARVQVKNFEKALAVFRLDTGIYPSTEQGLEALRSKPSKVDHWDGPYLRKSIPLDPWGHPYLYKYPGEHGNEPDIISYGADGQPGGEGSDTDIVSWDV